MRDRPAVWAAPGRIDLVNAALLRPQIGAGEVDHFIDFAADQGLRFRHRREVGVLRFGAEIQESSGLRLNVDDAGGSVVRRHNLQRPRTPQVMSLGSR